MAIELALLNEALAAVIAAEGFVVLVHALMILVVGARGERAVAGLAAKAGHHANPTDRVVRAIAQFAKNLVADSALVCAHLRQPDYVAPVGFGKLRLPHVVTLRLDHVFQLLKERRCEV